MQVSNPPTETTLPVKEATETSIESEFTAKSSKMQNHLCEIEKIQKHRFSKYTRSQDILYEQNLAKTNEIPTVAQELFEATNRCIPQKDSERTFYDGLAGHVFVIDNSRGLQIFDFDNFVTYTKCHICDCRSRRFVLPSQIDPTEIRQVWLQTSAKIDLNALKTFIKLSELTLRYCSGINSLENLPKLKKVKDASFVFMSELTTVKGIENLENLESLSLHTKKRLRYSELQALKDRSIKVEYRWSNFDRT